MSHLSLGTLSPKARLTALVGSLAVAALVGAGTLVARKDRLPDWVEYPGPDGRWNRIALGVYEGGTQADINLGYINRNILLVGPTGSGKTVVGRNILNHCLSHPDDWNIVGIDFKIVDLAWLKPYPQVLTVANQFEDAVKVLRSMRAEMARRYDEMEAGGVNNFRDLRGRPKATLIYIDEVGFLKPYHPAVQDKFADADNAMRTEMLHLLTEIAAQGSAAAVHLVIATACKTPSEVLPEDLLTNLSARILLDPHNPDLSMQLFDHDYTTHEPRVRGRGILGSHGVAHVFQSYVSRPDWYDQNQSTDG